jgi:methylenetetrahydrofolate reductase (NADPH)
MGIGNLLVMSGDYPTAGQFGLPMPVFDLDPVHAITLLTLMNKGWCICHETNKLEKGPRTNFFIGAVVSPFKYTEAEFMPQMYKMEMKVKAGARYFVTQLGFDARKLKDLKRSLGEAEINIPVIGSVFILRKSTAALMNRGSIPGTHVTDELLTLITKEAEADDRGIAGSLERAAMQVAVLKGLGFKGAHLEAMVMKFDMVETILGRAKELADTWEECAEKLSFSPKGSFYLGENDVFAQSQASRKVKNGWFLYRIMRIVHDLFFVKTGFSGTIMRFFSRILERVKSLGVLSHWFERYLKLILFDCCDCGDCALPELHYLCPQSQCPKQQRNGPCGGSHLDGCEVYPDRPCVWTRVYVRAKAFRELDTMRSTVIGPLNWKLQKTSAWVNYHLGYDHTSYDFRTYFTVPERKE